MRKQSFLLSIVALVLLGTACGGGGGGQPAAGGSPAGDTGGGACSPAGTALQLTAQNVKFDKDCLAAPADTAFSIEFTNSDGGVPHNVSIGDLFKGKVVTGVTTTTYKVNPLADGEYTFQCDVHPAQMRGTFVVAL